MCIFCDIISGKITSSKVYEDDDVLAILDVSQVTFGHTLVMPKKHVADILEADEETVVKCAKVISKLSKQIVHNTGAAGCNVLTIVVRLLDRQFITSTSISFLDILNLMQYVFNLMKVKSRI